MKRINEVVKMQKSIGNINRAVCVIDSITYSIFNNNFDYNREIKLLNDSHMSIKLNQIDTNIPSELNYFDKAVYDAICSLLYNRVYTFTTAYIYRVIIGNTKACSNINLSKIEESIYKLNNIIINLSCKTSKSEIGKYKFFKSEKLLSISQCRIILKNGQEVEGWMLTTEPALYKYAKNINKIECFKFELFNTPLTYTDDNVKIAKYLFEKLLLIKNNISNNDTINFSELYQIVDIDNRDHSSKAINKRKRTLDKCEKILDFWKNKTGALGKWGYASKGNEIIGYRLKINLNGFKILVTDFWIDGSIDESYEEIVFEERENTTNILSEILGTKDDEDLFSFYIDNDIDSNWID